ncbi:MAG: phosphotransferase, partial [Steroidobacteraceae bacterium]
MSDATQEDVLAFLSDPASHGGDAVKRIDTHAATVFLASGRVFKVKRAVKFPFLDYSTLAKRKAACEAEIEVNATYAPELYRGVVAITRGIDGRLAIGGDGEPAEWAVEMRRFDESRTLDHIAEQIDDALANELGRAVAAAHAKTPAVEPEPWIAAVGSYIEEHVEAFREHPDVFPAEKIDELARASRSQYGRILPLLHERGRRGLIRRIHGDLHLGNIALIDGKPVLFDAIEFSPIIASGDVLYDLAFLLMDLLERGRAAAANIVLDRYLTETRRIEDLDALAALPFYLSMRAAIRAKVTAERLDQVERSKHASIAQAAKAYFDFAQRAIAPPNPTFIAVGGLSGTGKSRLARALAPHILPMPGAVAVRSDIERKILFDADETERLGGDAYKS